MRTRSNRQYPPPEELNLTGSLLNDLLDMVQQQQAPSPRLSSETSYPPSPSVTQSEDIPIVNLVDEEEEEDEQQQQQQQQQPYDSSCTSQDNITPNASNESTEATTRNTTPRRRNSISSRLRRNCSTDVVVRNLVVLSMTIGVMVLFFDLAVTVATVILGLLRPAWLTFKALEARPRARARAVMELRNWQTYWIIVSFLVGADWILRTLSFVKLPLLIHNTMTFAIVAWLTRGHASNAAMVYDGSIRPFLLQHEHKVDKIADNLLKRADVFSQTTLRELNRIVEPKAIRRSVENVAAEVERTATEIGQAVTTEMERPTVNRHNRRNRRWRLLR